jgi:hypothetical protein
MFRQLQNARRRVIQATVATDAARISGGTYNEMSRDIQDQTFYDTVCFSATLDNQSFFIDGVGKPLAGAPTVTKSLAHTNIVGAGSRLPSGYQFLIKGLSINAQKRVVDAGETAIGFSAAVARVLQASNFRIVFPGRDFDYETPGDSWLPTIASTDVIAAGAAARTGDFLANKLLPLRNQIVIGSVGGAPVDFQVKWFVDRADSGVQAALNTLTGGATPDALKFGLVGTLEKLK